MFKSHNAPAPCLTALVIRHVSLHEHYDSVTSTATKRSTVGRQHIGLSAPTNVTITLYYFRARAVSAVGASRFNYHQKIRLRARR